MKKISLIKVQTRPKLSTTTKLHIGLMTLAVWIILGLTGNLGNNSFLIFFSAVSTHNVNLTWTAPGDNNNTVGTSAAVYDIRYSTSLLTDGNWAQATQLTGEPTPGVMGTAESLTVSGLEASQTYYFGLKSADAVGNWSNLSNIASVALPVNATGGGGGGSPTTCQSTWSCTGWSSCSNNLESRTCTDLNHCSGAIRPEETRTCSVAGGSDEEPQLVEPTTPPPGIYGAGSLIRTPDSSALYYIGTDYKKYVFPDEKTFFTWFADFDIVQWVPVAELDKYGIGGTMTYRGGTYLVKTPDTNKVYAVEGRGRLYWIADEATAVRLYGSNWAARVRDVIPGYFASTYTNTNEVLTGYPNGTILKYQNEFYLVVNRSSIRKVTADGLRVNRFLDSLAVEVSSLANYSLRSDDISAKEVNYYYLR